MNRLFRLHRDQPQAAPFEITPVPDAREAEIKKTRANARACLGAAAMFGALATIGIGVTAGVIHSASENSHGLRTADETHIELVLDGVAIALAAAGTIEGSLSLRYAAFQEAQRAAEQQAHETAMAASPERTQVRIPLDVV